MPRIQKLGNATNFVQPFFESSVHDMIMHNSFPPTHHFIHCEERIRAVQERAAVCRDAQGFQNQVVIQLLSILSFYMQPQTLSCTWP